MATYVTKSHLENFTEKLLANDKKIKDELKDEISNLPSGGGSGSSYTLPTASTTTLGGVKVDGTTVTIDSNGVISAAASGSGDCKLPIGGTTGQTLVKKSNKDYDVEWKTSSSSTAEASSIPSLYLKNGDILLLLSKKSGEVKSEFTYESDTIKESGYCKVKIQGTSSAAYIKKNYTLNFYEDAECSVKKNIDFGWGAQSKYCIKANWIDSTHTRNIISAQLAAEVTGSRSESDFKTHLLNAPNNGCIDGFPIEVYINDGFHGLYTMNIPKDTWMFGMDKSNPNHMVLCAEMNNDRNTNLNPSQHGNILQCEFRQEYDGSDGKSWSIEVGTLTPELKESFNEGVRILMSEPEGTFKEKFEAKYDLQSIIDYYLVTEYICNIDGNAKNMLMATYDGVKWGAICYDMDSTYGANTAGNLGIYPVNTDIKNEFQDNNSLMLESIMKYYKSEYANRYKELRELGIFSTENLINKFKNIYYRFSDKQLKEEKAKWVMYESRSTYVVNNVAGVTCDDLNTLNRFSKFLSARQKYLDEKYGYKPVCTSLEVYGENSDIPETGVVNIANGNIQCMRVVGYPENCDTSGLTITSSNPSVVRPVGRYLLVPLSTGTADITYSVGSVSKTISYNITGGVEGRSSVNFVKSITNDGGQYIKTTVVPEDSGLVLYKAKLNQPPTSFQYMFSSNDLFKIQAPNNKYNDRLNITIHGKTNQISLYDYDQKYLEVYCDLRYYMLKVNDVMVEDIPLGNRYGYTGRSVSAPLCINAGYGSGLENKPAKTTFEYAAVLTTSRYVSSLLLPALDESGTPCVYDVVTKTYHKTESGTPFNYETL